MADIWGPQELIVGDLDVSGEAVKWAKSRGGEVHDYKPLKSPSGVEAGMRKEGGIPNASASAEGVMVNMQPGIQFFETELQKVAVSCALDVVGAESVEGDRAYLYRAVQATPQIESEQGNMIAWNADLPPDGDIVLGNIMARGQKTATGNGSGVQLGAVAAGQTFHALLQVLAAVSGTFDLIIESDDNGGFSSPTTRFTFQQVTTTTGWEYLTLTPAGGITDDWWRASWTSASSPDHSVAVSAGIL